jgi:hypothetical protein
MAGGPAPAAAPPVEEAPAAPIVASEVVCGRGGGCTGSGNAMRHDPGVQSPLSYKHACKLHAGSHSPSPSHDDGQFSSQRGPCPAMKEPSALTQSPESQPHASV